MSCYIDEKEGVTTALLTFSREQLQYDINNYAYIEGSVMPKETEAHNRHTVQDVGEEGNIDRVTRVLNLEIARVREILYPYTKHDIHHPELDDKLRQPGVYGVALSLPAGFSQTTLNLLEKLIHEYLVYKAMEDWMSITNPGKMEIWRLKAEEAAMSMRRSLGARQNRVRRKLHPF